MTKKLLSLCLALTAVLSSCTKDPDPSSRKGWDEAKALKLKGTINTVTGIDLKWLEGQELAVFPINAKVVETKAAQHPVKVLALTNGAASDFKYTDRGFMPDNSIGNHKFAAVTPYVATGNPEAVECAVPSLQDGTSDKLMKSMPLYAMTEVTNPMDGAVILMQFKMAAAIVRIPVITGDAEVRGLTLETEEGDAPIGGKISLNLNDGSFKVLDGSTSIASSASLPASGNVQYYYLSVLPGNHTGKKLHAKLTLAEGEREIILEGTDIKAGSVITLEDVTPPVPPVKTKETFEVDLSGLDFADSYIYEVKDDAGRIVAVVTKEYLGKATNQQAVVVYGTKPNTGGTTRVIDAANPVGLVAQVLKSAAADEFTNYEDVSPDSPVHGGYFSFKSGEIGYLSQGDLTAMTKVFAVLDNETGITTIQALADDVAKTTELSPRTFVFSDRGEEKAYKLVKICRQIWFAEDVSTYKYNDGSVITKVKAAELYPLTEAGCVNTASTSDRIMYNALAINDEKFLPVNSGWKVPTIGDFKNLIAEIPQSGMITSIDGAGTPGNNIALLSIQNMGRITNKSWSSTKTMDPCFWSSSASETDGQQQCLVVRVDPATVPSANSGQNIHFGFFVRLMRGLY